MIKVGAFNFFNVVLLIGADLFLFLLFGRCVYWENKAYGENATKTQNSN